MLDWHVFIPVVPMMEVTYHIAASGCQGALLGSTLPSCPTVFNGGPHETAGWLRFRLPSLLPRI